MKITVKIEWKDSSVELWGGYAVAFILLSGVACYSLVLAMLRLTGVVHG